MRRSAMAGSSLAAVEQGALQNRRTQHFLQAHRVGAKLDLVGAMRFWAATLVLDGIGPAAFVYLDHIGDTRDAELQRAQGNASLYRYISPALSATGVSAFVEVTALGGEEILGPLLLIVDECTLTRTVEHVL